MSGMIFLNEPYSTKHITQVQSFLSQYMGSPVLLTPSCTSALELSALALNLQPDDEVILPSYTFPSTANAFVLRGCKLVFCDIRPDTLNINENLIESLITDKTKAIIPVHYGGVGCNLFKILEIADKHNLYVIEDNAHGLFGEYLDNPLGSWGDLGCLSFHATKNYSCGEGGAIIVNNEDYLERIEIIREKGTNRNKFLRGKIDKYTWVNVGSSCLMANRLAQLLLLKLQQREIIQARREQLWWNYVEYLFNWIRTNDVTVQYIPKDCTSSYHLFCLILPDKNNRDKLQEHLKNKGIQSASHFEPLHSSPMGKRYPADCPVSEDISQRLLRLPLHNSLAFGEQKIVIEAIKEFTCNP